MDYGTNTNSLSLTGGDNIDDIDDTLIDLATNISSNLSLINDVSGSLNTLNIQVQDLSGVVDENIIDICNNTILIGDVSYNLNALTIEVQDLSGDVIDISNNKVSKTGDTMTGKLTMNNCNIDLSGASLIQMDGLQVINGYDNYIRMNEASSWTGVRTTGRFTQTISSAENDNQDYIYTTSIRRSSLPHHIDTYNYASGVSSGRKLYLNFYSNSDVSVGGNSGGNLICYNDLDVDGGADISGDLICNNELYYKGDTLDTRFHPLGDYALSSELDAEETARISADNTLQTNIDAEETARISADNTLQTNIDAEETARISADNTLQTNIDNEETARIAGDALKVSKSGDTMTGDLLIENSSQNPTLTLWSKNTGTYKPTIELIRNSETFGADGNYDWRIINDGGTFKLQTQGTNTGYTGLRNMFEINAVGGNFTIGDNLSPLVLDGNSSITGDLDVDGNTRFSDDVSLETTGQNINVVVKTNNPYDSSLFLTEGFTSESNFYGGRIKYDGGSNRLEFGTGQATSSSIAFYINRNNPDVYFQGDLYVEGIAEFSDDVKLKTSGENINLIVETDNDYDASLFLTEYFTSESDFSGGIIKYDGSSNRLEIGTRNVSSGSTAFYIDRNNPDVNFQGDVVAVDTITSYNFKTHGDYPLISQVHSFIQPAINNFNQSNWLLQTPHYDSNANSPVFGIKSPVPIVPYAIAVSADSDADSLTTFTFQVRARSDTSDVANLTTGTTSIMGSADISVEENDAQVVNFTSVNVIQADYSWGLYCSAMSPNGYAGELVVKVYFYQGGLAIA